MGFSPNYKPRERNLSPGEVAKLLAVRLRGTKTKDRDRDVPIVHENALSLLAYALAYGRGEDGRLFLP